MQPRHYRNLIVRAVEDCDEVTLNALVSALGQAESAKQILRAKGFGASGQSIEDAARLVPLAHMKE